MTHADPARPVTPSAWAYWPAWKAPFELLVRVGRAAAEAASGGATATPCEVRVQARNDLEVFHSTTEFKENVTRSALRNFDHVDMNATGTSLTVSISFVRWNLWSREGAPSCPWLRRGVLLQVTTQAGDARPSAIAARERITSAIARGVADATQRPRVGETWNGLLPEAEIEAFLAGRTRVSRKARLATAVLTPLVLISLLVLITSAAGDWFVMQRTVGGDYVIGTGWFFLIFIVGPLLGWFVLTPFGAIGLEARPSVAVREHALMFRLARWIVGIAAALLVTAAISRILGLK